MRLRNGKRSWQFRGFERHAGNGIQLAELRRGLIEENIRRDQAVGELAIQCLLTLKRAGAVDQILEVVRARGETHGLQRDCRERHSDGELGYTDTRRIHEEPAVTGAREDAAARNRVAVDRGDDRARVEEQNLERARQPRKKLSHVPRATCARAHEIDPG